MSALPSPSTTTTTSSSSSLASSSSSSDVSSSLSETSPSSSSLAIISPYIIVAIVVGLIVLVLAIVVGVQRYVTNAIANAMSTVPDALDIVGGNGTQVTPSNNNQTYTIDNIITMRKIVAGETITKGANVSILDGLLRMGYSDPGSTMVYPPNTNLNKIAMMSDNNFVLVIAKPDPNTGVQIGVVVPVTYVSGTAENCVYQIGTETQLPTFGTTNPGRIANAYSIAALDSSRFVIVYSDTSGTGTTAVINRLVVGSFTPGSASVLPVATLNSGSFATYGTDDITATQTGTTITGTQATFTVDMVNSYFRWTSGPFSGVSVKILSVPTSTTLTVNVALSVPTPSKYQVEYGTDLAMQGGNLVTDAQSLFTTAMIGSNFLFDAGALNRITNATANTLTVVNSAVVSVPTYFSIVYGMELATQAVNTVTDTLSLFLPAMAGSDFLFDAGTARLITAFVNSSTLTIAGPSTSVPTPTGFQIVYHTGTVSAAATTMTGVGTTFTPAMVGGTVTMTSGAQTGTTRLVTGFTSSTVLTVSPTGTIASGTFTLAYRLATVSQTTTTITAAGGTSFTSAMVGGTLLMTSGAQSGTSRLITGFVNSTTLTAATGTLAAGTFTLTYRLGPLISQTTTTATASNALTVFTPAMNRGLLSYQTGLNAAITNFLTSSTLTVTPSQTVPFGTAFVLPYLNGTVGQTLTTVTGTGTVFTPAMVGGILTYTSGASSGVQTSIVAFLSSTQLTVSSSATVLTNTSFSISYGQSRFSPDVSPSVTITTENNFRVVKQDTDLASVVLRDNTNMRCTVYSVIVVGLAATISGPTSADTNVHATTQIGAVAINRVDPTHFLVLFNDTQGNARYTLGTVNTGGTLPPLLAASVTYLTSNSFLQNLNYTLSRLETGRLILFFQNAIQMGQGCAMVFDVTNVPTVVVGDIFVFYKGGSPNVLTYSTAVLSPTHVVHFFVDSPNANFGESIVGVVDGMSLSFGGLQTFSVFNPAPVNVVVNPGDGAIFVLFRDTYDTSEQIVYVPSVNLDTLLLDYTLTKGLRSIGFAQNGGPPGTIINVMVNGFSTAHTGLIPGQDYFGHGDGANDQFADPQNRTELPARVGTAISTTDMVIRIPS